MSENIPNIWVFLLTQCLPTEGNNVEHFYTVINTQVTYGTAYLKFLINLETQQTLT